MENNSANKVILVILVLIAVALGVAIYVKNNPISGISFIKKTNSTDQKSTDSIKESILNTPGKDATDDDRAKYSTLVANNSVPGDTLEINDCKANPLVLKVKFGSTITVKNIGTKDIHFGFDDERTLVKSGTSQKVKTNYSHGAGIYGYGCDDPSLKSIGVLLITE